VTKTHHLHLDTVSELKVKLLVADHGVVLVQLVELALLEEENRIVVVLLDLPELRLERRKFLPRRLGDVNGTRVVVGVTGPVALLVLDVDKEVEALFLGTLLLLVVELLALGGSEEEVGAIAALGRALAGYRLGGRREEGSGGLLGCRLGGDELGRLLLLHGRVVRGRRRRRGSHVRDNPRFVSLCGRS
jgi:hypothetical protein